MDVPAGREKDLDEFLREDLFTSFLAVPGALSAKRYRQIRGEGHQCMVVWEVERHEVTEGEAYEEVALRSRIVKGASIYFDQPKVVYQETIGFRQVEYEQEHCKYLLAAQMDVSPELEKEFNDWYDTEHVPLLMRVPGWMASRRFIRIQGNAPKYLALYELESPAVLDRSEHEATHKTEWYRRLRPHFENFSALLYERLYGLSR